MGLLFGSTRHAPTPVRAEDRSFILPAFMTQAGSYAAVDASGEGARQSVAIDTAIDLICSLVSELPMHVYSGEGKDRAKKKTPSNLEDPGDTQQGAEDWIYSLVNSWLYRGNVYGTEIAWDPRTGDARKIDLHYPDDVSAQIDPNAYRATKWYLHGQPVERPDLFVHRRVNPIPGRLLGASMIEKHALQTRTSIAAAMFGSQWFSDGAHPSGMLLNTEAAIDAETATKAKSRWMAQFNGSREPVVMGRGWEWKQLSVNPNESQFLETLRFTEAQCARIFGPAMAETLGYESGGSLTYTTTVERRSDLLALSLGKWIRRTERVLTGLIPRPWYVRFDRDALLESSTLARYEAHAKAMSAGWKTANEVRDDEDMAPLPGGDQLATGQKPAGGASSGDAAGV